MEDMTLTRLGGVLVAVALSLVATGFASASTDTSSLTLTIAAPEGPATTVELTCDPSGGSHPDPKAACAELLAVAGDFDELSGDPTTACTMEYRPVVANADGTWHGRPVYWEARFSNDCTMTSATGTIFRF